MTTETAPPIDIEVAHNGDAPVPPVEPLAGPEPSHGPRDELGATADQASGQGDTTEAIIPVEVVQAVVSAGFDALANRRGTHWHVTDEEAHNIAVPLTGELDELAQYAPFLGGAADALGSRRMRLLAAVALTVTPRLVADAMLAREERREAVEARANRVRPEDPTTSTIPDPEDPDDLAARLSTLPPQEDAPA